MSKKEKSIAEIYGDAWPYQKAKMKWEMHTHLCAPSIFDMLRGHEAYKEKADKFERENKKLFSKVEAEAEKLKNLKNP